jgi:hypothetical protein
LDQVRDQVGVRVRFQFYGHASAQISNQIRRMVLDRLNKNMAL